MRMRLHINMLRLACQPIEEQINHRRRKQRQHLRHNQPAHNRDAQRPSQLASRARAQRQWETTQQRRHRRHHDRPEPQQTSLIDRLRRRHPLLAFGLQRKVDHHDRILLHNADQQNDSDQRNHTQVHMKQQQRQNRAHARRRQRRQNRDRVNVALIQHTQHNVDDDQRRQNQQRLILQRSLKRPRRSLKLRIHTGRHIQLRLRPVHRIHRIADRLARRQIERDRHSRELALVTDHQRRRLLFEVSKRRQRHLRPIRTLHINVAERSRIPLKLRSYLQHHVILVLLRKDRRHLPLRKRIIQRIVDVLRCNPQPRSCIAVDHQARLQPAELFIARHIAQNRNGLQLRDQLVGPQRQLLRVRVLKRVLVLRPAHPVFHRQILQRLQKTLDPTHLRHLRLQPLNHLQRRRRTQFTILQIDLYAPTIQRRVRPINSDERRNTLHILVLQNNPRQRLLPRAHRSKADRLRTLSNAQQHASILHREEALRHDQKQVHRQQKRAERHQQRQRLMPQHPPHAHPILCDHIVKELSALAVERRLLVIRRMLQQLRRHHRRQRQRNKRRGQNCNRQSYSKLTEQSPHNIAHEQQRNQHRDQAHSQRNDGKPNLLRALQRGLQRRIALFQVSRDVLDHHDRIVHHKSRRDRQRHQRQVVQAVPQQIHHAKRAHNRKRHRHGRNHRRRKRTQEQEDHHHHQPNRQDQRKLHILHRRPNRIRPVCQHLQLHRRRHRRPQLRQYLLNLIHHADDVRARLPLDVHNHRRLQRGGLRRLSIARSPRRGPHPRRLKQILCAVHRIRHIRQPHRRPAPVRDNHIVVAGTRWNLIIRANRVGLRRSIQIALRLIHIRRPHCRTNVLKAQPIVSHRRRVILNPHRRLLSTVDRHQPHARELRNLLCDHRVRQVLHLLQRQRIARQRQRHNRRIRRIHLAIHRRIRQVLRQITVRSVDRRLHILLRHVDRLLQRELQRNHAAPTRARRRHLAQPRYLPKLSLQRRRHRRRHHLRARPGIKRLHLDRRIVHLRQRRHRQLHIRNKSRKQNGHHQKRGGHWPKNKWPRRAHGRRAH